MGGDNEQPKRPSGGSGNPQTGLQLDETEAPSGEGGVSVSEQSSTFSQLGKRSINELLSTSPISVDEFESILRTGGNFGNHYLADMPYQSRSALRIAARFSKNIESNAKFLKREYLSMHSGRDVTESGKGFDFGNRKVCAWFTEDGIELGIGNSAKNNATKIVISWESAAEHIDMLMREGRYITVEAFDYNGLG